MPKTKRSPIKPQQCPSDTDNSSVPREDEAAQGSVGRRQKRRMLDSPSSTHGDQADTTLIEEFRQDFANCISEMRELRAEMAQLRESFSTITARLDGVESRLEALERQPSRESDGTAELERTISALKLELNDRDQEALLSDLDIGLLPEEKGENVVHTVTVLAARLGVTLEERDVVFAERVGAPPGEGEERVRRVVVRLARRGLRDELLRAARVRRTGLAGPPGVRVFVNERLTRPNRLLFRRARAECSQLKWMYCWTKRGRIYVRQGDGLPAFQLRTDDDFTRVLGPRTV